MKTSYLLLLLVPLLAACSAPAPTAQDASQKSIRTNLEKILPAGRHIEAMHPSPAPTLTEVVVDGRIAYVTADGKYLLQGPLVELSTQKNLTDVAEAALRRAELERIGDDRKITFAAAHPKYRVTVFTDVECGYCRKLHEQIAEYNAAGITIDYLLYPRAGAGSSAYETSVHVWCAADRRQALTDAKQDQLVAPANCPNPIDANITLGHRFGFPGTPAMFAPNGTLLGGYLSPTELRARLDELAREELKAS